MRNTILKKITITLIGAVFLSGCGKAQSQKQGNADDTQEAECSETEIKIPITDIDTETIYANENSNQELVDFLINYYQIPEEYLEYTRYYYNDIDLNEDGKEETIVVIVGEYTECYGGDPALILGQNESGYYVLESFDYIRTPVYISDNMTNGWHDIIFPAHGGEEGTGYKICHYASGTGYQGELTECVQEFPEDFSGKKILSNNFIDDMDKGNYLTLKEAEDNPESITGN